MNIVDGTNRPVLKIDRPFKCAPPAAPPPSTPRAPVPPRRRPAQPLPFPPRRCPVVCGVPPCCAFYPCPQECTLSTTEGYVLAHIRQAARCFSCSN